MVCNYLSLFLYITIFVVEVTVSQSSVKHLEIGRLKPKSSSSMSRYMINLYEKYKDGEISEESRTTVRSIPPMKGKLESRDMLVYNLSNVPASEKILKAELHIHFRRRKSKPQIYSLELWNLMETSFHPLEELSVNENDVGWTKFDTTNAVHECIQSNAKRQCLIGVSMECDNGRGTCHPLSVRRMFGLNIQPFLVLFSERVNRNNTTTDDYEEQLSEIITEALKNNRNKRSIHNNELPEYPAYDVANLHSRTSLDGRSEPIDSKLLSHPPFSKNPGQRRRKRNKKIHKILHAIRKKEVRRENDATVNEVDDENFNTCQKRKLVISFTDLGWESLILAPDEIESNYCAGDCRISQISRKKDHPWTNHAYIQALLHLGGNKIPLPCCSPEKMSAVTILYIDEDSRVTLKHLYNTKVEECNCR